MSLWKLKISMIGTLVLLIGISTLLLAFILEFLGGFTPTILITAVLVFNVLQWLFAPYIIEAVYHVKEVGPGHWLQEMVSRIAEASGISAPKAMIAEIPIPNAFAYGSPLTGNRVAVTRGLIETVDRDELEAVIAHEIGHIIHKDMHIMMIASLLPALFYIIGRSLLLSGYFYRGYRDRDEGGGGLLILIGIISMVASFILQLITLGLSRLREYYADAHAAMTVNDGALKLQIALAKISENTARLVSRGVNVAAFGDFRQLFIVDPSRAVSEYSEMRGEYWIVEKIKSRELTFWDRLLELFSTHPNIVKRLRALDELRRAY